MGCGRSKHSFSSPRMVKSYNEHEFSGVIRGYTEPLEAHELGIMGTCCRRRGDDKENTKDELQNSNADNFGKNVLVRRKFSIKKMEPHIELRTPTHSTLDVMELKEMNIYDAKEQTLISPTDVKNRFASNGKSDKTILTKDNPETKRCNSLKGSIISEAHPASPFKLLYVDDDYRNIITEHSSSDHLKAVQDEFEYPKFPNTIAITGIGYQYVLEIHKRYHFPYVQSNLEEKLSFQMQRTPSFSTREYTTQISDPISPNSDVRLVQDCGGGSSGFQSGASSTCGDTSQSEKGLNSLDMIKSS